MDFTLRTYQILLESLLKCGYQFHTFSSYLENQNIGKTIILRHDVDLRPENSLKTAKIEHEFGIKASYYFRAVPESWNESIIKEIASIGHEIGYHYESLTTCGGDIDAAYDEFCLNLNKLRCLLSESRMTICMHGSPKSPYDSRDIWRKYTYKNLGVVGEPYFDIDFSKVFYLTDTGRRWDGFNVSVRDRIPVHQDRWTKEGLVFHTTKDIIYAAQDGKLPEIIMVTTHPQRWSDNFVDWGKELLLQNIKNTVKFFIRKG